MFTSGVHVSTYAFKSGKYSPKMLLNNISARKFYIFLITTYRKYMLKDRIWNKFNHNQKLNHNERELNVN